jgi:hypothetical protein
MHRRHRHAFGVPSPTLTSSLWLVAGMAIGIAIAGLIGSAHDSPPRSTQRVDSGPVGRLVWEAMAPLPSEPPRCRTRSADGIGTWYCEIHYATGDRSRFTVAPVPPNGSRPRRTSALTKLPADGIATATVTIGARGDMAGTTAEGRPVSGCCVPVRSAG